MAVRKADPVVAEPDPVVAEPAPVGTPAPVGCGALAGAIEVIASFVAGFEPERFSPEDAAILVEWFCRAERVAGAGKTLAAARVAASNRPTQSGHATAARWLASVTGQPMGQSIEELELGAALAAQPDLDAAFRGGRVSRPGASLVASATEANPARGADLVEGACREPFSALRGRCLAARAEGEAAEAAGRRQAALHAARRCRTWTGTDGAFRLAATLTPETGAALAASLRAEAGRRFEQARRDGVREPRAAYVADALVALVTEGGSDPGSSHPGSKRKGRARVTLRVDLDALRRGATASGEVCEIPGVGPVPVGTARDLLGDALVDLVVTNGIDVTTICHLGRSIPAALETALVERDRSCVVPGCTATEGLEFDHWGIAFAEGGPASLENLARLCAHHHDLRTHRGFTLSGGPGRWVFEAPEVPKPPRRRGPSSRAPGKRPAGTRRSRAAPSAHAARRVVMRA